MAELLTINEASDWATNYTGKKVTNSNISYLIQYGRIKKIGDNGSTQVEKQELTDYYSSMKISRKEKWKEELGEDLNWELSFEQYKESETTKHVHRLHPYKGKFIPQLVDYFLNTKTDKFKTDTYFQEGDIVLDPFSGSGTTMVQSCELGIHSIGIDVSVFNSLIANCKVNEYDLDSVEKEISKINSIDYKHVLFRDVFVEYEDKPDLPLISNAFFLNLNSKSGAASVLSDQTDNCLFATKNYNGGKIYFSAFSLDDNHEFLKHPLFVAMFYNIIIQSQPIDDLYFIAGRNNSVDIQVNSENSRVYDVLHIVDSVGVDIIPMYRNVQGVLNVLIPEVMLEKGHYEIVANNDLLGVFSLNYDRTESILEYYSEKELSEELTSAGLKEFLLINTAEKDLDSIIREQKKGKELWRLFVFIALFFITCEILIIRLMK